MAENNMIVHLEPRDDVIDNFLFRVWNEVRVSQRLVWGGNQSNPLFRLEASYVEFSTSDLLADLHVPPGESLYLSGAAYHNITTFPRPRIFVYRFWDFPGFSQVRSAALLGQSTLCPASNAFRRGRASLFT